MTDWLRAFVRTEATHPQARTVTGKAPNEIARKPNETATARAGRLIDAFGATTVDRDRLHVGEMTFFWRYTPEEDLQDLMRRIIALIRSAASERIGEKATEIVFIHQVGKE